MTENELITVINSTLTKLIPDYYSEQVTFIKQHQLKQDGLSSGHIISLGIQQTKRYGFPQYREYDDGGNRRRETTRQLISKMRVTTTLQENFQNPDALTCHDLAEVVAEIMESPEFQQELINHKVNLERITEIITFPVKDDNSTDELQSYFDVFIQYKNIRTVEIQTINKFEMKIKRI